MAHRLRAVIGYALLASVVAATIGGCGGGETRELVSGPQAIEFVDDLLHGKGAADWHLGANPVPDAAAVWSNKSRIEALGDTLREHGTEWSCDAAKAVHTAKDLSGGIEPGLAEGDRQQISGQAIAQGGDPAEINSLIEGVLELGPFEMAAELGELCEAAEQL